MAARCCLALLALVALAAPGTRAANITKFIAAEEVDWDYAPSGKNLCRNTTLEGSEQATWTTAGAGRVLKKARFLEYTGPDLATLVERPAEEEHLALLGPLLRVAPGDTVTVVFTNRVTFALRLDPAGLTVQPTAGAASSDSLGAVAAPGETVTYAWTVPAAAAPAPDDPAATKLYLYRSTLDPGASDAAGLVGPILVSRDAAAHSAGRDVVTVMQVINENASPFLEDNAAGRGAEAAEAADLEEGLLRHAINGRLFCNLEGLMAVQGEDTRWHFGVVGSEADMHTAHLHGNTWLEGGHRADQVSLIPGSVHSVALDARAPGTWLFHCHVADHITAGMMALYTVAPAPGGAAPVPGPPAGTVRRHFVAAEEVAWDYAPLGGNACAAAGGDDENATAATAATAATGAARPVAPWTDEELVFTGNGTGRVGSVYQKARYIEYTDGSFTTKKARPEGDSFLGLLGPVLRGEVGDTLEVTFLNRLTNPSASMHPHGVAYAKSSEGAPYADGTGPADRVDDAVAPGANVTYTWAIPESAGPGPADPSSVAWLYHSHTDEVAGPYAGLVGAILVGRPGAFSRGKDQELGTAGDVDVETVALFAVMDERQSALWGANAAAVLERDAGALEKAGNATAAVDSDAPEDAEAQLLHAINGFVYCNGPELRVRAGDRLRLHVLSIGTEVDMHSPALEGASLEVRGQRGPAAVAMPGSMQTADIVIDAPPGPALLQCRVADHIAAGMQALVRVVGDGAAGVGATTAATDSAATAASGVTRPYFIQAEETRWDYAPLGENGCAPGGPAPFTDDQLVFVGKTDATIGPAYKKAVYGRYKDATFDRRVPVPAHHGLQGPLLAAEVGNVLEITFRNDLAFPANLRLDGGFVPTADSADPRIAVAPNATVTYRLLVPAAAGPGPADLNTVAYGYGSSVDYIGHPMAGLVGMVLVGTPGTFAGADAAAMPAAPVPSGAGGVLPLVAAIFNENESPFFEENAEGLAAGVAEGAEAGEAEGEAGAEASPGAEFYESNLMHALNGFLFCNMPRYVFDAASGAPLRVAVLALGSDTDLHSITVAGQVIQGAPAGSPRGTLEPLLPAAAVTADLAAPLQPGLWPVACAVHDHVDAGMQAMLEIKDEGAASSAVSASAGAAAAAAGLLLLAVLL